MPNHPENHGRILVDVSVKKTCAMRFEALPLTRATRRHPKTIRNNLLSAPVSSESLCFISVLSFHAQLQHLSRGRMGRIGSDEGKTPRRTIGR